MAKFTYTQNSFSNGELNPDVLGRTDIKEYFKGAKKITDFVVTDTGAAACVLGSTWLETPNREYNFTIKEKYAFGIAGSSLRLSELKYDGPSGEAFLDEITLTKVLPANAASFVYGTHISINNITIITDKTGVVSPLVLFNDAGTWTVWVFSAYAERFGDLSITAAVRKYRSFSFQDFQRDATKALTLTTGVLTTTVDTFTAGMVGSYIIIGITGSTDAVVSIDAFNSAQSVDVTVIDGSAPNGSYSIYKLPAWHDDNWPKIVSFFQNRVLFANTTAEIDIIWNSKTNDIVRFSPILIQDKLDADTDPNNYEIQTAASPFQIQPATEDASEIKWIVPERSVSFGTGTEEYIARGLDGIYSDATTTISSVSKYGSYDIGLAFRAQSSTYFIERNGVKLREMSYSDENGGYVSRNISILGPVLGTVSKLVYDYSNKRVYAVAGNKTFVCTLDQSAGISAWAEITLESTDKVAGVLDVLGSKELLCSGVLDAFTITVYREAKLPSIGADRVVGGRQIAIVEVDGDDRRLFASDYYLGVTGTGTAYFKKADGTVGTSPFYIAAGHATFANGELYITTTEEPLIVWKVPISSRIETAPIQQGSPIGDAQIHFQRADKISIRLTKSYQGFKAGTSDSSLEVLTIDDNFTGVKPVNPAGSPEIDHSIIITNDSPNPLVVASISMRGVAQEG